MPERDRALEWLQRRKEGEPVAAIAARAGVPAEAVRRATDRYGPFPPEPGSIAYARASRRRLVEERAGQWVELRRGGVGVDAIADRFGVTRHVVSEATKRFGPFPFPGRPSAEQVDRWVQARRHGTPVRVIARDEQVAANKVHAATRPFGPFRRRPTLTPDGWLGRAGAADLVGVSYPTLLAWDRAGDLPPPDRVSPNGRRLWRRATIEQWLPASGLHRCGTCGAHVKSPPIHQASCPGRC